jgi:uncharacterized protein
MVTWIRKLTPVYLVFVAAVGIGAGQTAAPPAGQTKVVTSAPAAGAVVRNRAPVRQNKFDLLPLGAIAPEGWLRQQLLVQAAGLTGHIDEIWPDLGPDSGWLGGTGEAWERGPYFLDGLIPLAYELKDPALMTKANRWVEWTLTHQQPSGQIGPTKNDDWWPRMVMLKVLTQYQEVTGDARVIPLMQRYFAFQAQEIDKRPLFEWSKYRWQDELVSVVWLYNRTGDPKLLDLARRIHSQGYDWRRQFEHFPFTAKQTRESLGLKTGGANPDIAMQSHGVNNAMALKASPVWGSISGQAADVEAVHEQIRILDRYHGLPNGMFSADEHFAGPDPSQGIELCAVVEAMFSYENIEAILGDADFGDRLERIAFNALPGTLTDDMWAHQYDQQPNQIKCTRTDRQWSTNGPESNLFGLEPNFGCCTANMHQGWPKLVETLWMATPDGGLATVVYAPNEVRTVVGKGIAVKLVEESDYPFEGHVRLTVEPQSTVRFPLRLRVPAWANGTTIQANGKNVVGRIEAGTFYTLDRDWHSGDHIDIDFPMQLRVTHWYHNSVVIERGPLVYALAPTPEWSKLRDRGPASDWEVRPTTPWNYALAIDEKHPERSIDVVQRSSKGAPFSMDGTRIALHLHGRRLPGWTMVEESAGPLPMSPVTSAEPEESLTLVPYGAAKLRITAFPFLSSP